LNQNLDELSAWFNDEKVTLGPSGWMKLTEAVWVKDTGYPDIVEKLYLDRVKEINLAEQYRGEFDLFSKLGVKGITDELHVTVLCELAHNLNSPKNDQVVTADIKNYVLSI